MARTNTATTSQSWPLNAPLGADARIDSTYAPPNLAQARSRREFLKTADTRRRCGYCFQSIAQRQDEGPRLDVENVPVLRPNAVGEGERCGSEEVHVNVARPAEQVVLEVVILQVAQTVRHVRLARQEWLFPERLTGSRDTHASADIGRRLAQQQLRTERGRPQLGMRQIEVVDSLGNMVRELVGQRAAQAKWRAVRPDDIDSGELRLFAAVQREL